MRDDNQVGLYGRNGAGWAFVMDVGTGNIGVGTTSPASKLDVNGAARADSLEVNGGAIRVLGAGAGTATAAFIHYTDNLEDRCAEIDHSLCNGRPDALLFVTQQQSGVGDALPITVYY